MDETTKQLRWLKQHRPRKFADAIMKMSDAEAEQILHDYWIFARDSQLPPEGDWRYWIILAGRGLTNQAHVKPL